MHETKIHAKSFRFLYANYSKALEAGTLKTGTRGHVGRKKFRNLCFERLDQQGSRNKNIVNKTPSAVLKQKKTREEF